MIDPLMFIALLPENVVAVARRKQKNAQTTISLSIETRPRIR